ncbi:hypothetical protein [Halorubellus sp. JP-L1]|nr:hypothetical protein [Halorubellus sp. JP-L1]
MSALLMDALDFAVDESEETIDHVVATAVQLGVSISLCWTDDRR